MVRSARLRSLAGALCGALFLFAWATPGTAAPGSRTITVKTADELLLAIGSNRTIRVQSGHYRLDLVSQRTHAHVFWTRVFDGHQVNVRNVKNLKLIGVGTKPPVLEVAPRYAWVLRFVKSQNVALENLVLGHTRSGFCVGGVVAFERSKNVKVARSELYGSGTIGVSLKQVAGFLMDRSTIRDCTYGILEISRSKNVRFQRSEFRNNREYDLIEIKRTRNVRFDQCTMTYNRTNIGGGYALFKLDKRSSVIVNGGTYAHNSLDAFTNAPKRLRVIGSAALKRHVNQQLQRADPRFNMIYRVIRYRTWIVTGSQAGIVFWDPKTQKVVYRKKAFISASFLVQGKYLWAGTYRNVFRFDGTKLKQVRHSSKVRGFTVFGGPGGSVLVRQRKNYWEYDAKQDALVKVAPAWAPYYSSHAVLFQRNGAVWTLNFLSFIERSLGGARTMFRRRSATYAGGDPRSFYQDPTGRLWVIDFNSGFFRYNASSGGFDWDSTVTNKGSAMAVDTRRRRAWFLHYTDGLYLKRPSKPVQFINLAHLRYLRGLYLDKNGDVWVGGWNRLLRIYRSGSSWLQQSFVVR